MFDSENVVTAITEPDEVPTVCVCCGKKSPRHLMYRVRINRYISTPRHMLSATFWNNNRQDGWSVTWSQLYPGANAACGVYHVYTSAMNSPTQQEKGTTTQLYEYVGYACSKAEAEQAITLRPWETSDTKVPGR